MSNEIPIYGLKELQGAESGLKGKWIFRGEACFAEERDNLKTSIEKAFTQYQVNVRDRPNTERDLIREFQRKLHLYESNLPARNDIMQWLALMQHYGAPTRLLDWTYSFWVATFFAVSRTKIGEKTTLWAMQTDAHQIENALRAVEKRTDSTIKGLIRRDKNLTYCDKRLIEDCAVVFTILGKNYDGFFIANPFRMNDRLTIQQGVFVIPCNIKKSFQHNIELSSKLASGLMKKYVLHVDQKFQKDIIGHLRQMNINSAVLFPGLQGFADSLWMRAGRPMTDKLARREQKEKLQLYTRNT